MTYSILSEARIRNSLSDQQPESRGYSTFWPTNGDLQGWTTFIDLDIVGAWSGFLFGTKRSVSLGLIGPSNTFLPVDSQVNDKIFFRMKYDKHPKNNNSTNTGKIRWTTVADPIFDDIKSVNFNLISNGQWVFYEINVGEVASWVGLINNIQFFPSTNGAINDEFFLNFFEIGTNKFDFNFDNPKAGKRGKVIGGLPLVSEITIQKDVNDKLIINIDNFGDVQITLTPQTAVPFIIARDISFQLGSISIGGYLRSQVFIDDLSNKLIIESGISASDSSVEVKFGTNSAAVILGLTDSSGTFLGISEPGLKPDFDFVPSAAYRLTTLEILSLFDNDNSIPSFFLDPQAVILQAGRKDFSIIDEKLDITVEIDAATGIVAPNIVPKDQFNFTNITLIDLNHPFTDDGEVSKIFANGIFDQNGGSKWKIFRPMLDGNLTFVSEGSIGKKLIVDDPTGGLVTSPNPGTTIEDVSSSKIKVRAGDLLGIFNASLNAGREGTDKIDASFYTIQGDIKGTITPPPPSGAGEAGLAIYAIGKTTKTKAVIDIDLGRRLNIDKIKVSGNEDQRDLEYNLGAASSTIYSADVKGDHTVCFTPTPNAPRTCFQRNNIGFNITALNDGETISNNGITGFGDGGFNGIGGADANGATYFYVNGDSEFFNTFEFVNQGASATDFVRDPLGIDVFFSNTTPRLDKPIGKVIIYFKEKKNMRTWQIEHFTGGGGDGSKQGFSLIPPETIQFIKIDDKTVKSLDNSFVTIKTDSNPSDILLGNPVILDAIAGGITRPVRGVDFKDTVKELGGTNFIEQITFLDMQWNKFEWDFDSIRTAGFRWFNPYHFSTKIVEFEVYAVATSNESLVDNIQVLFSDFGKTFISAKETIFDKTSVEYKLGNSPQFIRIIFRPTLRLSLNDISIKFEEDQIFFGTEGRLLSNVSVKDAKVGTLSDTTPILITNNTGQTADLIIDLPPDVEKNRKLIFFSKLHNQEDLIKPQVGPPVRVDFTPDKTLKETENIAINAKVYGLLNLTQNSAEDFSKNLIVNGDFETGDLTSWLLNVTQSGILRFQSPRVFDINIGSDDESSLPSTQTGNFIFGFEIDNDIPFTKDQFVPVHFTLNQTIDISQFNTTVDTGLSILSLNLTHRSLSLPDPSTTLRIIGGPTKAGAESIQGTLIPGYGNNLLRSASISQPLNIIDTTSFLNDFQTVLISGTRFIRIEFDVVADSPRISRMKFLLDAISVKLKLSQSGVIKWYKAWRNSTGNPTKEFEGFTDASFIPVSSTQFINTIGSSHWWQPFDRNNTSGNPSGSQTQSFSNAFLQDRVLGIQSFRRMRATDPGILGAQWEGERDIAGLRIAFSHRISNPEQYPRHFHIEVLKTIQELGGVSPDIANPAHSKIIRIYVSQGPFPVATTLTGFSNLLQTPDSIVTTWLFEDGPVKTEGIKIIFTLNCDRFEAESFETTGNSPPSLVGNEFINFTNQTTCPPSISRFGQDTFTSSLGIGVSFFVPLESRNITSLPITNEKEFNESNTNIHVAVDLGRPFDIDLSSNLFELISETIDQNQWNTSGVVFSDTDTDDPNLVQWTGSSSNARWIRFFSVAVDSFEPIDQVIDDPTISVFISRVNSIPQSTLFNARIYPKIQTTSIFGIGFNSQWQELNDIITDTSLDTFIFYSDFPIIAVDLGKEFFLEKNSTIFIKNHVLTTARLDGGQDPLVWDSNTETNFAYASKSFIKETLPERIKFDNFGIGVPDIAIRWLAFRGAVPLLRPGPFGGPSVGPKQYNFETGSQTLIKASFRPRNEEIFTQNSSWFTTKSAKLKDISTFKFIKGILFNALEGIDFGSGPSENLGSALNVFDGQFDRFKNDIWGVAVRDGSIILNNSSTAGQTGGLTRTFVDNPKLNFPHFIWRLFRDLSTGEIQTKKIKAINITGFNENFFPTDFSIQRLFQNGSDPNNNFNWVDIVTFTGEDTFQQGAGLTHVFVNVIVTTAIRILITKSIFPDDSGGTQITSETVGFSTVQDVSGPQTRVISIQIFEEEISNTNLIGTIETDHVLGAVVSSLTVVPDQPITFIQDDNIRSFWQSTGFTDTITIALPRETIISKFQWEQDKRIGDQTGTKSAGAPLDFTLKAVVGGIPIILEKQTTFSGINFSTTFDTPVLSDTFIFDINSVQGQLENASSIILSRVSLIEVIQQVLPLVDIDTSFDVHPNSLNNISTKVTYVANSDAIVPILLQGIDAGDDELWSQRDFFTFWLKINNINLFDTTFGVIKLGNDSEIAYTWNISDLSLVTGWNKIRLEFKDAVDKAEIELDISNFNQDIGESKVDFITKDVSFSQFVDGNGSSGVVQGPGIRFFEFKFRGTKGSEDLKLVFDDMKFERNKFDDKVKFAPSLYLNNSEFMTLNLNGLDLATGTVEFWISPDWSATGRIRKGKIVVPSLFRMARPDGKFFNLIFRPNVGFVVLIFDSEKLLSFVSNVKFFRFQRFDVFHFAVSWEANSNIPGEKTSLVMWVNGNRVYETTKTWISLKENGNRIGFGGEISQRFSADSLNNVAATFTALPNLPTNATASSWAGIENLKIYNYAKTDFSDIFDEELKRTQLINASDMLQISLDNNNFESVGSSNLPLVKNKVKDGESVNLFVKTDIPKDLTGIESRDTSVLVRWKTPLIDCK